MTLIGVLVAIAFERLLGQFPGWGEPVALRWLLARAQTLLPLPAFWRAGPALLLWLLPPVLLVYGLGGLMANPLARLAFAAAVLLLCLGPRDLADDVSRLLEAREAGDEARAAHLAGVLMRGPQPESSQHSLLGALFIQSHERLFGVLLWFFALGPAGAVLYRQASRLPRLLRESLGDCAAVRWAEQLHAALAFIPARLTALLFGLAGSLDDTLKVWRELTQSSMGWRAQTWAVLAEASAASVNLREPDGSTSVPATLAACLREVLSMQWRALLILLAVFALTTTGTLL